MSKTNDYWVKRFEALEKQALNKGTELYKELEKQYSIAYSQIEKNILSWYNRFAKDNSISFVEAKKILTSGELQEFKWSLEEYIKYASDSTTNTLWAKQLQNASTRVHISRLDSLRIQIQNEVEKLYNQQLTGMTDIAETIYEDNYYHTAYELQKGNNVAWNLNGLDSNKIAKVLKSIWTDNSTFSDKIWSNKSSLIQTLNTGIVQNIIQGNSPDNLIDLISKKFNTDLNKAGRLVMTESAYFAAEAQKDCFNELGVEKYKVLGTLDTTTCENCGKMDLQIFDMKDYQEGITAPPFHPWCRCTTIPAFDDDDEFNERIARNADGDTYYVSGDTTYEEWKKKYVDNTESENVTNSDNSSIMNNINKINDVNEFYAVLDEDTINELTDFSSNENGVTRGQKLNSLLNYDELPTVVSQDEFETLSNSSKYGKLYRGVSGNSIEETEKYVNDFKSGNLYAGKGVYGNGTYTAYGESGLNLVKSKYATENGQVMTMLLDNNAKVINYSEIYKMRDEELKIMKDKVSAKFINAMAMDCGYYASIKGYDAIILDEVMANLNNQPYIIILNRGKVIISE